MNIALQFVIEIIKVNHKLNKRCIHKLFQLNRLSRPWGGWPRAFPRRVACRWPRTWSWRFRLLFICGWPCGFCITRRDPGLALLFESSLFWNQTTGRLIGWFVVEEEEAISEALPWVGSLTGKLDDWEVTAFLSSSESGATMWEALELSPCDVSGKVFSNWKGPEKMFGGFGTPEKVSPLTSLEACDWSNWPVSKRKNN